MMAGVLLRGCCSCTEPANAKACKASNCANDWMLIDSIVLCCGMMQAYIYDTQAAHDYFWSHAQDKLKSFREVEGTPGGSAAYVYHPHAVA